MTREGAVEVNAATGKKKRISKRIRDADFAKTEAPPQPEQAAQPLPGGATSPPLTDTPPLPHAPGAEREQDTAAAERVLERIDGARTRKASKKAARKAQAEATAKEKSSRLQFTDEERATPELERYIRKSDKAADRLDAAKAAIPKEKKLVRERTFDEATGKGKTRLHFEEQEKPIGKNKPHNNPLSRPAQEAGIFVHNKIHSVEKDNSGVEGAHKSEELAERGAKYGARKVKEGYHSHKLKPYRAAAKAEKAAFKANVDFQYHKALHDNPQIAGNPLSRFMQKQQIKRQYAKSARKGGAKTAQKAAENTRKAAKKTAEETKKAIAFVGRHPAGVCIAVAALLLFIMVSAGLSSCGSMFSGLMNGILGTSYTSEDSDLVATENNYAAKENELQQQIDNIESTHPGYDEYRYDLDSIGHNPHELASYLTALLQSYTPQSAQAELNRVFDKQYTLTLTEEIEVRYRTETRTDTWTDEDGNSHTDTYQVPYDYYICTVTLENFDLSHVPVYVMGEDQLSRYAIYMATLGNRPDLFPDSPYVNKYITGKPGDYEVPGEYLDDEAFAAMLAEAQKYIGYPYVWGGSSPATFFDCSGYVSWVINHSGWNVGRLGAQGLYNICTPISSPKPGDLVFFKGTYDTPGVSHCGIYVGDGKMLHCGDPIGYANLNTSYWQSHFYAYGRLP